MGINLSWQHDTTPVELLPLLRNLSQEYPIFEEGQGKTLRFNKSEIEGICSVEASGDRVDITYDSLATAGRGIANALAGLNVNERTFLKTFGVMIDSSRNAVMTVAHLKKWIRRLTLMGYNMLMLYTEDVYQLPGEPKFGYRRGAYSMEEIKEIDTYAKQMGITIIPCFQTLAHMEHVLKHPEYSDIRDTNSIMMVGEEKTYKLIDKMLAFWSEALTTRRVHIGLDEAFDLGRGAYLVKHGLLDQLQIFEEHIDKVVELCDKHSLKPMIWSDMYFRLNNPDHAYRQPGEIPDRVVSRIPRQLQMVYWDYYNRDQSVYEMCIRQHSEIGFEPIVASGLWTWDKLWNDHTEDVETVKPCLAACRKTGVEELFFTLWGDNGAYCEPDSVLGDLCWSAMLNYAGSEDSQQLEKFFEAVTFSSYAMHIEASRLESHFPNAADFNSEIKYYPWLAEHTNASRLLWDDPVEGANIQHLYNRGPHVFENTLEAFDSVYKTMSQHIGASGSAGDLKHAALLADFLRKKLRLHEKLRKAYSQKDIPVLELIVDSDIPELISLCDLITDSWTTRWLNCYKPFGFETILSRQGFQRERWKYLAKRLIGFVDESVDVVDEL